MNFTGKEITRKEDLRPLYAQPGQRALGKQMTALDRHARNFIAHSPFLVMGTAAEGGADVSPKGDAPGFVAVLDDRTLLIPDRPGNNRLDGMRNILENPRVGLLFLIPGVNETLRVNGRARITRDEALLAPLAVQEKRPKTALVVEIDEVYLHCPKAFIRSRLWDPEAQLDRAQFPTMGQMLADQIEGMDVEELERGTEESIKHGLY